MKIFVTGGTGFVGRHLCPRLALEGHYVTVLARRSRSILREGERLRFVVGDPTRRGGWQQEAAHHDVIINLAGASIFGRWTHRHKERIRKSRIETTGNLVDAIIQGRSTTLFSASAVGYYGFHGDEILDESAPAGGDFLAALAAEWEIEALRARHKGARVVITRFGMVLGADGGALQQMVRPFRWFVGGPIGSGKQWISWIHIEDLVRAFLHLLDREELSGAFNFTSPEPVSNRDFSQVVGRVLGRPSRMPAPAFLVRMVLGEFGSVILHGQRVVPLRLLESGFRFRFPLLEDALRDLLGRSR